MIEFLCGDITELEVDAIVCPAHKYLSKGRGLSAQIFEQAGEEALEAACSQAGGCKVGGACLTPGFKLPAKHIIHTVTPQWTGGDQWGGSDLHLLANCYDSVVRLALEQGVKTIAFPALGAGTNKTPQSMAAHEGLEVLVKYADSFERLIICLHWEAGLDTWRRTYEDFFARRVEQSRKTG
ncbi:predicted phosphatase [Hahella chejuensis KCTC 2396]|uniref:Predicted phosphatase n=1 Tax=Hahella chejuensis (strain KCTC 2396) TaxID=349521 RepID=Q2SM57_HAHCH|nr:macro domain-containing protein [Hahella chejuensis]ABC28267.1 predicted phosphatase [Hahella chejuensis KCTC 2396]